MIRKRLIQVGIVLFIGINFLLVYLDKEDKVDRISYVKSWSEAFQSDMVEKLHTPGVLAYIQEDYVYFDKNLGSFQEFIVEEGTQVNVGDSLYSYRVTNYYETEANLMQEIEKISGEIAAIELAISQMNMYQIPSTNTQASPSFNVTEEEIRVEFPQEPIEAELMKEQYTIEKEKELAQKNAELTSFETQLTELQSSGDTITVESPYEGKIKNISTTLNDPIITIENTQLHAEGELTEAERTEIEEGFPVEVTVTETDTILNGVINELSESPKEIAIEGESVYPFNIAFDEEADLEDLLPGYHTTLSITTNESPGATVLFEDVVFSGSVWKMTNEGKLVEQAVETGIYMESMHEITNGVESGDLVTEDRKSQFRDGATFITPLKLRQSTWRSIVTTDNENWRKYFVTGLLSR